MKQAHSALFGPALLNGTNNGLEGFLSHNGNNGGPKIPPPIGGGPLSNIAATLNLAQFSSQSNGNDDRPNMFGPLAQRVAALAANQQQQQGSSHHHPLMDELQLAQLAQLR